MTFYIVFKRTPDYSAFKVFSICKTEKRMLRDKRKYKGDALKIDAQELVERYFEAKRRTER